MIERTNPYKAALSDSIKSGKSGAKRVAFGGVLTAILLTMSGCGKDATEILQKVDDINSVPDNAIVFELDDGTYFVDGDRMIKFKDKSFKEAFEDKMSYYDAAQEFDLSLEGPDSLEELHLFFNLESLVIDGCDLEDLSVIKNLPNLKSLYLWDCDNVEDLSFLAEMDLEELLLINIPELDDLSFIGDMTSLKDLSINNCSQGKIDVDVLKKLDLRSLDLSVMNISDLDFLSDMKNLEELIITGSNLKDIEAISQLHSLKAIDFEDCLISDATSLYELTNLESISLVNNSVDSLDLSKFPNLKYVDVRCNYALYTDEFLNYCEEHNIETDITKEDVECMVKIRDIVDGLELDELSTAEKEAKIYAYVLEHMEYDNKGAKNDELVSEYNERALYHALQGKGVCATYAALFDAMCDVAGIDAFQVNGYAKTGLFGSSGGPHGWNLVEVDGQYMLCDPTWSDSVRDSFDYKILHLFEEDKSDKFFNQTEEDALKFMKKHIENAYERNESPLQIRSEEAVEAANEENGEVLSIETNEENGEKISSKVITGMITGSVVLVGSATIGAAVHSAKKKKRRQERHRREALSINSEFSSGYNNSKYY